MDTKKNVLVRLQQEQLPGLAKLYGYAKDSGLVDTSSVSIDPKWRPACDHVITRSHELLGIIPRYLNLYASLRRMGDGSGMFGFGARRFIDGAWARVSVCDHIGLIAGVADKYDRQHLEAIDKIADGFAAVPLITQKSRERPH